MMSNQRIVALIPARGGSKGIPRKNIKPLLGKPLLAYAIDAAKASPYIDTIVVSTDDEEIAAVARAHGAEAIMRPAELASDAAPMIPVMQQVLETLKQAGREHELVVLLQPTSPLRTGADITAALDQWKAGGYDSMLGLSLLYEHRFEEREPGVVEPVVKERKNRQERKPTMIENGFIYITPAALLAEGRILGDRVGYYSVPKERWIDIDDPVDFFVAEQLIRYRQDYGN